MSVKNILQNTKIRSQLELVRYGGISRVRVMARVRARVRFRLIILVGKCQILVLIWFLLQE